VIDVDVGFTSYAIDDALFRSTNRQRYTVLINGMNAVALK